MSKVTVGTGAAVKLDLTAYPEANELGQTVYLENLGPGDVYVDTLSTVTTADGLKVAVNAYFKLNPVARQDLYVTSSQAATDLRYFVLG